MSTTAYCQQTQRSKLKSIHPESLSCVLMFNQRDSQNAPSIHITIDSHKPTIGNDTRTLDTFAPKITKNMYSNDNFEFV